MSLGPVPKFFSDEPSKSLDELKKSPEFAFGCLQALVSKLLERGDLSRYLKYNQKIPSYSHKLYTNIPKITFSLDLRIIDNRMAK